MTVNPWPEVRFHGVVSWDSIHHNTLAEIEKAVETIRSSLVPGGLFMATIKSDKADSFGVGREIEPGTYVPKEGDEDGVPHHFFDEEGVRGLLSGFELLVLAERVFDYKVRCQGFLDLNPFDYTVWCVLGRR